MQGRLSCVVQARNTKNPSAAIGFQTKDVNTKESCARGAGCFGQSSETPLFASNCLDQTNGVCRHPQALAGKAEMLFGRGLEIDLLGENAERIGDI